MSGVGPFFVYPESGLAREWFGLAIDKIMKHCAGEIFYEHS